MPALRNLTEQLDAVQGRARAALKREFMASYGISSSALSRHLCDLGARSHSRQDAGVKRARITEEQLHAIARLQNSSQSMRKGTFMPAKDALDIAERNRIIEPGSVSESYYNKWLRDNEGSRAELDQPTPHIDLRSLGPNHVHQVDFSQAINWKLENNKLIYEDVREYKNKLISAEAKQARIWRLIVVDHATGAFFPFYGIAGGETVPMLIEGLYRAWTAKKIGALSVQDRYPFRGAPQILMADRGSTTRAQITVSLLQKLGVTLNICEGARSKGAVEVAHRWWEERFESRFRLQEAASIEQLNDWAVDFAARVCGEELHSRHQGTRSEMWAWHLNKRPETQLREIKCDFPTFRSIANSDPVLCRVTGARLIRFKSRRYRVPNSLLINRDVAVHYNIFSYPEIIVRRPEEPAGETWACTPIEVDEFNFPVEAAIIGQQYKAQPKTRTTRFAEVARAGGKELVAAQSIQAFGYHIERVAYVDIKHASEDVPLAPAASRTLTTFAARQEVMTILGRSFTQAEAEYVSRQFGEAVTEAEVDAAVAQIQEGITGRVLAFPQASGGTK